MESIASLGIVMRTATKKTIGGERKKRKELEKGSNMKRKVEVVEVFTLRDPGGQRIHAARVAAANADVSINTWLLGVIEQATQPAKETK